MTKVVELVGLNERLTKILMAIWQRGQETLWALEKLDLPSVEKHLHKRWQAYLNLRAFTHKNQSFMHQFFAVEEAQKLWEKVAKQDRMLSQALAHSRVKIQSSLRQTRQFRQGLKGYQSFNQQNRFIKPA